MKIISLLFCIISSLLVVQAQYFGQGNSSAVVLQDLNNNNTFVVEVDPTGNVIWTKGGAPYTVLGSKVCLVGDFLVGGPTTDEYTCVTNATLTSDTLAKLSCNASAPVPVFRTSAGSFVCEPDYDSLGSLQCPPGSVVTTNGTSFVCSPDNDWVGAAALSCPVNGVPRFNGSGWFCGGDADTLRDLVCATGQIAKFLNGVWACANDNNTLSTTCTDGQTLALGVNGWQCANDKDTFKGLSAQCTGSLDTPLLTAPGTWSCIASPTISLSLTTGVAVFSYGARFTTPGPSTYPTNGAVGGYSGAPWISQYPGSIRAWSIHAGAAIGASGFRATVALFLNGVQISVLTATSGPSAQTPVTVQTAVGSNFNQNDVFGFTIFQNASTAGFVTVNIYASQILT